MNKNLSIGSTIRYDYFGVRWDSLVVNVLKNDTYIILGCPINAPVFALTELWITRDQMINLEIA